MFEYLDWDVVFVEFDEVILIGMSVSLFFWW